MTKIYYEPPKDKTIYFKIGFCGAVPASEAYLKSMDDFIIMDGKRVNKADVDWNKPENASRLYELTNHDTLHSKFGERYNKIVVKSWNDFMNSEVFYDEKPIGKIKDLETFEIAELSEAINNSIANNGFDSYAMRVGLSEKEIVEARFIDHFRFRDSLYILDHDENKVYNEQEFKDHIKELSISYPYVANKYRNMTLHKMQNHNPDYKLFQMNYKDSVFFEDEFYIHNTTGLVITKQKQMIDNCLINGKKLSDIILEDYRDSQKNKVNSEVLNSVIKKHETKMKQTRRNTI
ncbi:hypothetical protein L7E35_004667 [Vibrio parahaemolyticus]|nr:hypothetical protein [Vibrio parahaemolyticus]EIV1599721.1 hypothetical protein [Vibrio parahaemolyticus]